VAAQGGSQVDRPRPAEHPDREVAQDRHDVWRGTGADLGGVLTEGDVADVVQRLDGPVRAQQISKPGRAGRPSARSSARSSSEAAMARRLSGEVRRARYTASASPAPTGASTATAAVSLASSRSLMASWGRVPAYASGSLP
jgi:hypothetical protein